MVCEKILLYGLNTKGMINEYMYGTTNMFDTKI